MFSEIELRLLMTSGVYLKFGTEMKSAGKLYLAFCVSTISDEK